MGVALRIVKFAEQPGLVLGYFSELVSARLSRGSAKIDERFEHCFGDVGSNPQAAESLAELYPFLP
jgi:hypothetical protein